MPIHVSSSIDTATAQTLMLQYSPVGMAFYDIQNNRLLSANEQFIEMILCLADTPLQREKIIGYPSTDWLTKIFVDRAQDVVQYIIKHDVPFISPERCIMINDQATYWTWTVQPHYDEQHTVTHVLITLTDITTYVLKQRQIEQRQIELEQARIHIEEEYKRLEIIQTIAQSIQGTLHLPEIGRTITRTIHQQLQAKCVSLYTADDEQQQFMRLDRYPMPLSPSIPAEHTIIPYNNKTLLGQIREQHKPTLIDVVGNGPSTTRLSDSEPIPSPSTSYICLPLWFKDHCEGLILASFAHRLQTDGAEVKTLMGCAPHIAAALAHARLHAIVKARHRYLHTVLDQIPDGILLVDAPDGTISYINNAALQLSNGYLQHHLGVTGHQAHYQWMNNTQYHSSKNYFIMRALRGEPTYRQEHHITQADGTPLFQICSAVPLYNDQKEIAGAVAIFQDITDLKHIEQQKQTFLALTSHALRTPVTAIQGFAEILQMQLVSGQALDSQRSERAITGIIEYSHYLTYLIEEMLDLARLEKSQLSIHMEQHDLHATLRHVVERHNRASQHPLNLIRDGLHADEPLFATFDEYRIMQVLNNLISNATRYSPKTCAISLGLRRLPAPDNAALLWIHDEGIGIAEQDIPYLFERFHPSDTTERSKNSGLGIGLYLVKELVTRHAGMIWAESKHMTGLTVYVQLPLNAQAT